MAEIGMDVVLGQILGVLEEAFDGPRQRWSYFTDSGGHRAFCGLHIAAS
jgi:hypothetical protein